MMLQWLCALLQGELSELAALLRLGDCLAMGSVMQHEWA